MTAITLYLPDDLVARLCSLPADELNHRAAEALALLVSGSTSSADDDQGEGDYLSETERADVRNDPVTPLSEWAARKLQQLEQQGSLGDDPEAG